MGTLTISAAGFSALPVSAPPGWPANVTWPGAGSPNGTKIYTVSDANWIALLTWTASSQQSGLPAPVAGVITATAPQILLAWVQLWINGTINAVTQYFTPPVVPPTPIVIQ